jgi:hypothetical protein
MTSRAPLAVAALLVGAAVFYGSPLAAETAAAPRPTPTPTGRVFTNDDLATYSPRVTPSPGATSTAPAAGGPTAVPTDSSGRRIRTYGPVRLTAPRAEAARRSGLKGGGSSSEGSEGPREGPRKEAAKAGSTEGARTASSDSDLAESGRGEDDDGLEDTDAKQRLWRQRADTTQQALDAARSVVTRCQAELDEIDRQLNMGTSLTPWELPALRASAEAKLDSARSALAEAEKAAEYLETDARRSSVPPGWIREREFEPKPEPEP